MPARAEVVEALAQQFQATASEYRGQTRVVVAAPQLTTVMTQLRDRWKFDYLVDITCVDYLEYRGAQQRFGLVYLLANTISAERLTVRVFLDEPDLEIDSLVPLWEGANWMEREVYDMFGIVFRGHGDLRRILLPPEFTSYPLRKDYPLQGRGERHNFPVITRDQG